MPVLENAPELFMDSVPYWQAFFDLSSSRRSGMSLGAIPYSEVSAWLDENLVTLLEERNRYRHMISAMDTAFIDVQSQKTQPKSNGRGK